MRLGDLRHNIEAETETLPVRAIAAPVEGDEKIADLIGSDSAAAVRNGQDELPVPEQGDDPDRLVGRAVRHGIGQQV